MPEYFYHIAVETLLNKQLNTTDKLSNSLKPFTRSASSRSSHNSEVLAHNLNIRPKSADIRTSPSSASQRHPSSSLSACTTLSDHRIDQIYVDGTDMAASRSGGVEAATSKTENVTNRSSRASAAALHTKGRYQPVEQESTGPEWGIVHLYRDANATTDLYQTPLLHGPELWSDGARKSPVGKPHPPPKDDDCTTLCILAVPSYLNPADFLAFVGEKTRNQVSHFRMIRTARANRYMVLMKFRYGKEARRWQHDWNGKVFNSMEPETCHVVFLKSVEITSSPESIPRDSNTDTTYPKTPNDPFSASPPRPSIPTSDSASSTAVVVATKPLPPPTPSLVELPTCPVCLERMDETTGLLTILCQHVFHCTCLEKWSGGGCPVCRYTHDDFSSRGAKSYHKSKTKKHLLLPNGEYEIINYDDYEDIPLECETCRTASSLWQCLICGRVGCGRYEGKHAYAHFEDTAHQFSMDLESKRVWDYGSDGYVHRIIQDGPGTSEKLTHQVNTRRGDREAITSTAHLDQDSDQDSAAWHDKMENLALEYTHLLTSQLESQRVYFEEVLERAVDKASRASQRSTGLEDRFAKLEADFSDLSAQHSETLSRLGEVEKERDRAVKKGERFEGVAREMGGKWREERGVVEGLMERIKHLEKETEAARESEQGAMARVMELEEENRDLMLNFSMGEKIREVVEAEKEKGDGMEGMEGLGGEEIVEGTVGVMEAQKKGGRGRGKGRAK